MKTGGLVQMRGKNRNQNDILNPTSLASRTNLGRSDKCFMEGRYVNKTPGKKSNKVFNIE